MLTLAAARLCGYRGDRHIALAARVEFIHTATLLHDDVVDESDLRRGRATANAVWGNKASVLVGDFLFSRAFQLMVEDGSLKVLDILSRASAVIAEGEVLQLVTATTPTPARRPISTSSAARPRRCSPPPAASARWSPTGPKVEEEALESYGRNLGIAFQLVDDVLDYSAEQAELGKTVGDDFRDGKITLPVILAFRRGDEAERELLAPHARGARAGGRRSRPRHRPAGAPRRARATPSTGPRHYGAIARDALGIFPDGPEKRRSAEASISASSGPF